MTLNYKIANLGTASPDSHLTDAVLGQNKMGLYAFLSFHADFEFWISDVCVLKEPYWNIGELAMQLVYWLKTGLRTNFYYSSIDSDEKELFTLKKQGETFSFHSICEEARVSTPIDREELEAFIAKFQLAARESIKRELGYDVSHYL